MSVFNYCRRSKAALVVGDTRLDPVWADDRTIQKRGVKSLACIPVLGKGEMRAMLHLENSQTSDVFTPGRVEMLNHLAAQFGVSVENAMLYNRLNRKVRELEDAETERRDAFAEIERLKNLLEAESAYLQK